MVPDTAPEPSLVPDELAHGLVAALLDPVVRAYLNAHRTGTLELHWNADKDDIRVVLRHTAAHRAHLRPPTPRSNTR